MLFINHRPPEKDTGCEIKLIPFNDDQLSFLFFVSKEHIFDYYRIETGNTQNEKVPNLDKIANDALFHNFRMYGL